MPRPSHHILLYFQLTSRSLAPRESQPRKRPKFAIGLGFKTAPKENVNAEAVLSCVTSLLLLVKFIEESPMPIEASIKE